LRAHIWPNEALRGLTPDFHTAAAMLAVLPSWPAENQLDAGADERRATS
jgi:hypothetical protein